VNRELAVTVQELGAVLSGSILGVPRSQQPAEAKALHDMSAWIHLDLIDGGYPIGQGISRDILTKVGSAWPEASDIHLIHGNHQLDGIPLEGVGRLTLHLEPGKPSAWPGRAAGVREFWISIQPHAWTGEGIRQLLEAWEPDGVLMMLTPPGDPRFQADLTALDSESWAAARVRTQLGVDGGVTAGQLGRIVDAGAHYIVVGRALFGP
jgi:pentose-5-phosphate-3-epimerase